MLKYENQDEIIKDIQFLLDSRGEISKQLLEKTLDNLIWSWTEFNGKIRGCTYWSMDALDNYRKNVWVLTGLKFQHEHSVPREILVKRLKKVETTSFNELKAFMENYAIGVVVTPAVHIKLHEFDDQCRDILWEKPLIRYKLADVAVYKVEWSREREPKSIELINY